MAIVNFPTPIVYPDMPAGVSNVWVLSQLRIQTGVPKAMAVFVIPRTGTLDQVEFRLDTIGVNQAIKISFQDVSATDGNPDGVIDQFRVVPSASLAVGWITPGLLTSDGTNTGTKRSVTIGDLLAVVLEFDSTLGDVRFNTVQLNSSSNLWPGGSAYTGTNNGSAWTKSPNIFPAALKYDDGTYAYLSPVAPPMAAVLNTRTVSSASSPNERGLSFQLPMTVAVAGAWASIARAGDCQVVLYDTNGTTVLASAVLDKDTQPQGGGPSVTIVPWAPVTLLANTPYRLTVLPTTTTSINVYDVSVAANAYLAAMAGGVNFYLTTRTGAGAWSQTTTLRPLLGLLIAGVDVGALSAPAAATVGFVAS